MSDTPNYQTALETPLLFSDAAAHKVRELIVEENNPNLKLRVYISGGGCSGFQYGFTFDEDSAEDDVAVVKEGVTLVVDPLSLQYLMGAEIDYSESLPEDVANLRNLLYSLITVSLAVELWKQPRVKHSANTILTRVS